MRVTTSKSKNSESFYITKSYTNAQGKSTSTTIKKLGTLAELSERLGTDRDGVMAWAKEQARIETEKYKKENRRCSRHDPFSFQQAHGLQQKKTFYRRISFPSVYLLWPEDGFYMPEDSFPLQI